MLKHRPAPAATRNLVSNTSTWDHTSKCHNRIQTPGHKQNEPKFTQPLGNAYSLALQCIPFKRSSPACHPCSSVLFLTFVFGFDPTASNQKIRHTDRNIPITAVLLTLWKLREPLPFQILWAISLLLLCNSPAGCFTSCWQKLFPTSPPPIKGCKSLSFIVAQNIKPIKFSPHPNMFQRTSCLNVTTHV